MTQYTATIYGEPVTLWIDRWGFVHTNGEGGPENLHRDNFGTVVERLDAICQAAHSGVQALNAATGLEWVEVEG